LFCFVCGKRGELRQEDETDPRSQKKAEEKGPCQEKPLGPGTTLRIVGKLQGKRSHPVSVMIRMMG
jgi:hypothetical protein